MTKLFVLIANIDVVPTILQLKSGTYYKYKA